MLEQAWRVAPGRECTHCGECRQDRMVRNKGSVGGYARKCKRCNVAQNKAWRKANPDLKPKYDREYRQKNRVLKRAQHKAWYEKNIDRVYASKERRRALELEATVEKFSRQDIFKRDQHICYLCGRLTNPNAERYAPEKTTLEHRVPLVRGGEHSMANCATACLECNLRKGKMTDEEYLAKHK